MRALVALVIASALMYGATAFAFTAPPVLDGLKMQAEKVPPANTKRKQYLTTIELYSLRRGKQLEATLQVGHFRSDAPAGRVSFRRSLAQQVGTTVPVEERVAGTTVYLTQARKLAVAVWFAGRELYVLSIRADYDTPKSLIRSAVELGS
jgi:hypothetical protein